MSKLIVGFSIVVALALVGFGVLAGGSRRATAGVAPPQLVSMDESARAMQQAGAAMQAHGQVMIDEGQRTGDKGQVMIAEYWRQNGQALAEGGQWMAMSPTAPGNLLTPPGAVASQGSWGELTRTSAAMLHDPSKARSVDLEALRWNGEAMVAEGRNMAEHGRLMQEEVNVMLVRHGLSNQVEADLRLAAQTMLTVGSHLQQNGQQMVEYAARLRRSLGYR